MKNEDKTKAELELAELELAEIRDTIKSAVKKYNTKAKECGYDERIAYMFAQSNAEEHVYDEIYNNLDFESGEIPEENTVEFDNYMDELVAKKMETFDIDEFMENRCYYHGTPIAPEAKAWFPSSFC